jgi:hypothetical protein
MKALFSCVVILCVLTSCQKSQPSPNPNTSPTGGGSGGGTGYWQPDSLTGTTWVIYQYKLDDGTSTVFPLSDTLIFNTSSAYTYNGHAFTYSLAIGSPGSGANSYYLTLNDTPFGILVGYPPLNFKTYGVLNGTLFNQLTMGTGQAYYLWIKKI